MKWLGVVVASATLLLPFGQVRACSFADAQLTLIHTTLPRRLPQGTVVASVEFESRNLDRLYSSGLRVRIRRMLQGDYRGRYLIVRLSMRTSCDDPFGNGDAGRIVGIARGFEDGIMIVDPIMVSGIERHRLPDGYQLRARRTD